MTKRNNFFLFVFYLLLSLFSFRNLLLESGTIGHHIDWFIPPRAEQISRLGAESFYIWKSFNLGWLSNLSTSGVVEQILVWLGKFGLDGEIISKLFPIVLLALSGFSMYQLMLTVLNKRVKIVKFSLVCFLGGVLYSFSPVVFNKIVDGHLFYLLSYATAPLVFSYYLKTTNEGTIRFKSLVFAVLIFNLTTFQAQNLIMLLVILLCLILFSEDKINQLKVFASFLGITLLFQFYWLLPFLTNLQSNSNYLSSLIPKGLSDQGALFLLRPIDIFTLRGYFVPWFEQAVSSNIMPIWYFASFLLVAITFLTFIIYRRSRFVLFASCMILGSFFFMGATGGAFRFLNEWIFRNFVFMNLFRSVHHLMFIPAFFYPLMIGYFFVYVKEKFSFKNYRNLIVLLFIIILIYLYPSFTGNMGGKLQVFNDSPSYKKIEDFLNDKKDYRVMYLPAAGSPFFNDSKFKDNSGYGSDPTLISSIKPTFVSDSARWDATGAITTLMEKKLYQGKGRYDSMLLKFANVKYVIARQDRKNAWDFGAIFWQQKDAYSILLEILENQQGLKLVKDFGDMSLWENINYLPHFYIPKNIIYSNGDIESLPDIISQEAYETRSGIYLGNSKLKEKENLEGADEVEKTIDKIPKITFMKINPTKYRVKIEGAKNPYTLVFSESFNQGWKVYINKVQNNYGKIVASYFNGEIKEGTNGNIFLDRNTFETLGKRSVPEERHLLINGYANSWYITPEDANGDENYELIIEFWPQMIFYIGLFISGLTLVGCLSYLIYDYLKKKKKKKIFK